VDKLVGERIRKYRVISGLSQENMAEEIGMSTGNYGKIERGEISISITHLSLISAVLGKSI
jgi:transcriptional regulator with XRE-family HTH domain